MIVPLLLATLLPTIWIVDSSNGPGTNFTDLPAAVAAASTGDTILLRPGLYSSFFVSGKALTIRGAGATTTAILIAAAGGGPQQTIIDAVPAGATFYLSGVSIGPFSPGPFNPPGAGLTITGASTLVVLADVVLHGVTWQFGTQALSLSQGAEVHASRCSLTGGNAIFGAGGTAAHVGSGSTLAADASTFSGGSGSLLTQSQGAAGVSVAGGNLTLARSSAYGGYGQAGGGSGIRVYGGFARAAGTAVDVLKGGLSTQATTYGFAAAADAGSTVVVHGAVSALPAGAGGGLTSGAVILGAVPLPYLSVTGATTPAGELQATQPVTVTLDGVIPLAPFVLAIDLAPSFSTAYAPLLVGELLVPIPPATILQGTLDALGMLQGTLTPAVSAPSLIGIPVYAQFGVLDSVAGQVRMSNGLIRVFKN